MKKILTKIMSGTIAGLVIAYLSHLVAGWAGFVGHIAGHVVWVLAH